MMNRKAEARFVATVFHQAPAVNEQAQLSVVGSVEGTHAECWKQAKAITKYPVLEFSNEKSYIN